jgi:pimeloyl-ACP methyl ester carboxylesterase
MQRPETRYAWNGEVSLAYQVVGQGEPDLLYLQGYCSNVDMNWEGRHLANFLRRLARHGRLVVTDRRGWGCSERFTPGSVPDVDVLTDEDRGSQELKGVPGAWKVYAVARQ